MADPVHGGNLVPAALFDDSAWVIAEHLGVSPTTDLSLYASSILSLSR
jgi:hypothetical protein